MAAPKSIRDVLLGMKEQAVFGTPETVIFNQLDVEPFDINANLIRIEGKQATGARVKSVDDVNYQKKGLMPEIGIEGDVKLEEAADFLYSALQSVTEEVATPFKKTFIFHATQPDFAANAGFFRTIAIADPTVGEDRVIADCITKSVTFSCAPDDQGGRLRFSETLVGRGAIVLNQTLVTSGWLRKAQTHLYFHDIVRATLNVNAAGVINLQLKDGFEITITQNAVRGIGQSSGEIETFSISDQMITAKINIGKDTTWKTCRDGWDSDFKVVLNLAWGGGIAGDTTGDLDFTINGKFTSVTQDDDEALGGDIEIEGLKDGATEPVTVILADNVDRVF